MKRPWAAWVTAVCVALALGGLVLNSTSHAAESEKEKAAAKSDPKKASEVAKDDDSEESESKKSSSSGGSESSRSKYPPYSKVIKDAKLIPGMINLYRNEQRLLAELNSSHFNKDHIVVIAIARGIGKMPVLSGMTWNFGDDWIWQFRKLDDQIQIVRRNVRFTAKGGSPEQRAVELAYTDSVMFSLPIVTTTPGGGFLVDLTPVFMSDLPQISQALPGSSFSAPRSTWHAVKGFPENIELEVAATYGTSGLIEYDSVADSRGMTINVHYSISQLPNNGYKPRLADDRVGYFVTAQKDFSNKNNVDRFTRYINRWDLTKADPSAEVSPPKKPIIFWLEKTIPFKYREPIRSGILEWNKAFEKAGFVNAIEVRQQEPSDDWDPEDLRYNTFRWITSSVPFAMGPSRVNPRTGEILDADIVFDADFLQYWKTEYENFTPDKVAAMTGGPLNLKDYRAQLKQRNMNQHAMCCSDCALSTGRAREFALGSMALMAAAPSAQTEAQKEKMILQGLKEVTMHEVGHTLGLRHNFKASALHSLEDLNNPEKTRETGLTASVMDYAPTNIVPAGTKQGDYFSTTIGPYDYWAIEYGYKPIDAGSPEGELPALNKIASRSGEPELAYATDENTRGIDPDPFSNRYDLSKDPLEFAQQRAKLIGQLWPTLVDRVVKDGEGYQRARQAFGVLLMNHGQAMYFASRFVGGVSLHRGHKGDPKAPPPQVVVEPAKQREALKLVQEQIFSDKPFQFPPELYNQLAATQWMHWGIDSPERTDYPIHKVIALWQDRILQQLLSPLTLQRLADSELKIPKDKDAFTTAELLKSLTGSVFAEVENPPKGEFSNRKPAVSSLRRELQRNYLKRLSTLAMGEDEAPQDAQTIAYAQLKSLKDKLDAAAKAEKLDDYSSAHFSEMSSRIAKVLDARLQLMTP